jgi:toxin FitB
MTLGDAIIAGTALVYELTLVTRNIDDFRWIAELNLLNPFDLDVSDTI